MKMLTPTSFIRCAGLPQLLIAILMIGSDTALGASSDQLAFSAIFGEETVSQNLDRLKTLTDRVEPAERYRMLVSWVLPSETHSSIRLNGRFLDGERHKRGLYCPALELIELAEQLDATAALRRRILTLSDAIDRDQQRALNSLLFLMDSKSAENSDSTTAASQQLLKFMLEGTMERKFQFWPETVVCWAGLQDPKNWNLVADLVTELYLRVIEDKISAPDAWREQVAAMHGLLLHLQNGGTAASFTRPPELKYWIPADLDSRHDWDEVYPVSHWVWDENSLTNLASAPQSLLFYKFPLTGDFEISCELPSIALNDLQLMYGGEFLILDEDRRTIHVGTVRDARTDSQRINPPLTKPHEWTWCRINVRDNVCSTYLNGRLVRRRPHQGHAPWLVLRATSSLRHPTVRNLRIDGEPDTPAALQLVTHPALPGWSSPASSRGDLFRFWKFVDGDQGAGLASIPAVGTAVSAEESLIQYYRPLAEGESFEYEFFYGAGYQPAHPVIDDVFTSIKPQGLTLRRPASDGPNLEFIEHRGILKPEDWNLCRLSVQQNQLELILNGQLIHSFLLRNERPPLIGFYREADAGSVQIRNIIWRNRETPAFDSLESQFVNQVPRLHPVNAAGWDVMEHDFVLKGFPSDYFSTPDDRGSFQVVPVSNGLFHSVTSGDDWDSTDLQPFFNLQGDFEIVLEFDGLRISGQGTHGGSGIVLRNNAGRMIQFTRRERSANEHRVILTLRSPLKNRKVMTAESLLASEATSGRFRIVRQGDTYHFSFAEGDSEAFRTVAEETIEGAGETPDRFDIRMLAQRNTTARIVWKRLRVAAETIDQSRFVASGETVTDEQWALIESRKETLREIVLDGTEISDDDLARLKDHTGLRILWLKGTPITSEGIRHLENLTQLESLHLTVTNVDDSVGETLKKLTNLTSLGLSLSQVGDQTVKSLSRLPRLETIGLSRTAVTDEAIESLSRIPTLRSVNLQATNVSEQAIERLRKSLPNCAIKH